MMKLAVSFTVSFILINLITCDYLSIPDCPSLYRFNFDNLTEDQSVPPCFCDNSTDNSKDLIQINCVYGSSLDDLANTFSKIRQANKTVDRIIVEKLYVEPTGIPENFFQNYSVSPTSIVIRDCRIPNILGSSNKLLGLQDNLKSLEISRCILNSVPSSLNSLTNLEHLSLIDIGLETIKKDDLVALKDLQSLDLSDNGLATVEEGAFRNLNKLTHLWLGPGNALKTPILKEIKGMSALKHLDFSGNQIDTVEDGIFSKLNSLTSLNLATNIIKRISEKSFVGLDKLQDLGLQENLISQIEPNSFKDLKSLTSLSLRANYLTSVTPDAFKSNSLKWLSLVFNNMQELTNGSFEQTPNLEELDLSSNSHFITLDVDAFRGLTNLLRLNLSNSNLTSLDSSMLKSTPNLTEFDISNTGVFSLDKSTFQDVKNLQVLRMAETRLTGLPEGIFDNLNKLDVLDLYGNNWVCDKRLKWLIVWLKAKSSDSLFTNGVPFCQAPESLQNESLYEVNSDKLN